MAEVHQFAYGWINPAIAYVMSFLGALLGLVLAGRAGQLTGPRRARWLALAAVALGGTGVWLMHFMALLGFDVPGSLLRYDVPMLVLSLVVAVLAVGAGLFVVGTGRVPAGRIALGGLVTGLGLAVTHHVGLASVRLDGRLSYDVRLVALSVVIAVVAATVALRAAVTVQGAAGTVGAALLTAVAVCSMHYTGMAAVRVRLDAGITAVGGVSPFTLLVPICIGATVIIAVLAYGTVGATMSQEDARADALLAQPLRARQTPVSW